MGEILLHALLDSLKILPVLFLVYLLIEWVEKKTSNDFKHSAFLKNKYSPIIGAGVGLIPQCGFSVVATDLYNKRRVSAGTLIAVYIATSDEALPIMLSNPRGLKMLLPLLVLKFVFAVMLGYLVELYISRSKQLPQIDTSKFKTIKAIKTTKIEVLDKKVEDKYLLADVYLEDKDIGCCGHEIEGENTSSLKRFLLHPLEHSMKVFFFILIVNIVMEMIIHWVGEASLQAFVSTSKWIQPLAAALVGLIPSCASSIVLTNLYITSGLQFGALFTGLCVNAGIAYTVLLRGNSKSNAIKIIATIFTASVVVGYLLMLL